MLISVGGSPAKQLEGDEYVFVDQIWATKDHALRISIHINPLSSHLPFYFKLYKSEDTYGFQFPLIYFQFMYHSNTKKSTDKWGFHFI